MSDTKFTPGPWTAEAENVHVGCVAICHGDADTWFEIWSENWGDGVDQKANANLIAAAPELYEALEQAVTLMQDSGYQNSHVAVRAGKAALAKVRGDKQ